MKRVKSYLKVILGSLIIAITYNVFFKDFNILPAGLNGVSVLLSIKLQMRLGEALLFTNLVMLILGFLTLTKANTKKALLGSILTALFALLTSNFNKYIDLKDIDLLLITVFGGVLVGFGSSLIYKEERYAGPNDITDSIAKAIIGPNSYIVNYIIDALIVLFAGLNFGLEMSMYTMLSIIIIEYMCKKHQLGISESKVFYIITTKERAVKRFIMKDLHYDLTIFEVTGGYSKNESKIIMSAIPTKDYYKLKEGIKEIDPNAFISITDSYELINKDVAINKNNS